MDRFEAAAGQLDPEHAQLYPVRLAAAAAAVLSMDGVGMSVMLEGGRRVPLADSSAAAVTAERVEFTLGSGPCLRAYEINRPVVLSDLSDITLSRSDWACYAQAILARTPFRAVFGFPLTSGDLSIGTVCMYRVATGQLSPAESRAAVTVTARIFEDLLATGTFSNAGQSALRWVSLPLARERSQVWRALGMTSVERGLDIGDALALLRGYCYAHDRLLDEVAADIISGALTLEELDD